MRVAELFEEEHEKPMVLSLLESLLRKGTPVFYVAMHEGVLKLYQVLTVSNKVQLFSPQAPSDIAGTQYQRIETRAPGFYSWETDKVGQGHGNISFGFSYVRDADKYHIMKLPSVSGRTDFIFGLRPYVKRWEREHAN